jgi:S-DNA-T family DNA segregation ATPase FtsK/SpoIIIE
VAERPGLSDEEIREKSRILVETLSQFGLPVQVVEVRRGPTVTQFGIAPGFTERTTAEGKRQAHKVRVSQIAALADDLTLALAAPSLRVEAPVPGRSVVGIEVPNEEIGLVTLGTVMASEEFGALDAPLAVALGEDVAGAPVVADMSGMPHLLIAGTTGSGKSVCIKALTTCLAMSNRPDELRMIMIDPKMVEMVRFNGLPHLLGRTEVELERIGRVLRWVTHEMDRRYKKFAEIGARNLDDYNGKVGRRDPLERQPRIVVVIDELADLMMMAPEETERTICRIAQMARATGIHLVVATQRPSVDVVTGLIKANFPARISFATASQVDSRVILDMPGAETLLGKGDMLYLASDAGQPVRVQGCYVSEPEIQRVVDFWRAQTPGWPTEAPWEAIMPTARAGDALPDGGAEDDQELLRQAVDLVRTRPTVSASFLQRRLRIGYPTAARLMEQLEEMGLVGPQEAAGRQRRVIGGEGS